MGVCNAKVTTLYIALILLVLNISDAWVARKASTKRSGGFCYMEGHGIGRLKVGETKKYIDKCILASCNKNGNIDLTGCSELLATPPCYIFKGVPSLPFPKCCHTMICR